jgi:hypothetical protein
MAASAAVKMRMRAARDVLGGVTVVSVMLVRPAGFVFVGSAYLVRPF